LVEDAILEDLGDGVLASIHAAEFGRHEWLGLGVPGVAVVDTEHHAKADKETQSSVGLEYERKRGLERGDLESGQQRRRRYSFERLTYCQSNDKLKRPRPSLLVAPPKRLVRTAAFDPVACMEARHGIETELRYGKM
jgi:hypothetical protein